MDSCHGAVSARRLCAMAWRDCSHGSLHFMLSLLIVACAVTDRSVGHMSTQMAASYDRSMLLQDVSFFVLSAVALRAVSHGQMQPCVAGRE